MPEILLDGNSLSPTQLWEFSLAAAKSSEKIKINLSQESWTKIKAASDFVAEIQAGDKSVYGINTGFGKFANVSIEKEKLEELQHKIILSHCCGTGEQLRPETVYSQWIIRLNVFCRGNSGVRPQTVEKIISALEKGLIAAIPSRGSVGASGDLSPSAHATAVYLGEGDALLKKGDTFQKLPAKEALKQTGFAPLELGAKEGLSLINGTQLTSSLAAEVLYEARKVLWSANLCTAMTLEGLRASHKVFHSKLLEAHRHPGTKFCGDQICSWIGSETEISSSHRDCSRVQDSYSVRCAPQVHGSLWEEIQHTEKCIEREINASTDNPLLFPESKEVVSGGNFHAINVAKANDRMASALTTIAAISERRISMAMNKEMSDLPTFLTPDGGLNSGFMIAHVTAAALTGEARSLSFPASTDSIPTNDNKEDHVSMGPTAGFKALQIAKLCTDVISIELLCASQAIDLLAPLKSSEKIMEVHSELRKSVPRLDEDRYLSGDFEKSSALINNLFWKNRGNIDA